MRCSLEYLAPDVALARVHPEGGFGDPYKYAVVVVFRDGGRTAEIKGAMRAPTMLEWRAMKSLAKDLGVEVVRWDRVSVGAVRDVIVRLR